MQTPVDLQTLQTKLKHLEQIEALFAKFDSKDSNNPTEFRKQLGQGKEPNVGTFRHYMVQNSSTIIATAFDNCNFTVDDERSVIVTQMIQQVKALVPSNEKNAADHASLDDANNQTRPLNLVKFVVNILLNDKVNESDKHSLAALMNTFIAKQKAEVLAAIEATKKIEAENAVLPVSDEVINTATATTKPDATPVGYSKALTAAIMTAGVALPSFSAATFFSPQLMQFSPKFALLMGLHLSPAMLLTIAVLGAVLLSVGLYRMWHKSPAPVEPVVAPVVNTEPKPSCLALITKYTSCCFKLFKKQDGGNTTATATAENTTTNGADQPPVTTNTDTDTASAASASV
jgi:hypothetical protein